MSPMAIKRSILRMVVVGLSTLAAVLPLGGGPQEDAAKAVTQRSDGFVVHHDGFGFRNIFKGSPLPAALRGASSGSMKALQTGLGLPSEFGLCGGMSLAAADFYLAKKPIPDFTKPPEQGTALYEYLYQRQTESMGPMGVMALKFWKWMNLPDHSDTEECTQKLTADELPGIVKRLTQRQLVPIGLVLTSPKDGGKLWENHQILGYGVKEGEKGVVDLLVYDPNYPGDDKVVIRVTPVVKDQPKEAHKETVTPKDAATKVAEVPDAPSNEYQCQRISGKGQAKKVRGLFAMPYQPKVPPDGLGK